MSLGKAGSGPGPPRGRELVVERTGRACPRRSPTDGNNRGPRDPRYDPTHPDTPRLPSHPRLPVLYWKEIRDGVVEGVW